MKLKSILENFVLTEGRSQSISESEAREIYENHCTNHDKRNTSIYRGVTLASQYGVVHPQKYSRKSKNTENFYTLFIDHSPKWSEFPQRSKSLICTTSYDKAVMYGDQVFEIIPFDNVNIGICDKEDIWFSFDHIAKAYGSTGSDNGTLDHFNNHLDIVYKNQMEDWGGLSEDSYTEFKSQIIQLNDKIKKRGFNPKSSEGITFWNHYKKSGKKSIWEYISWLLDPKENGITHKRYQRGFTAPEFVEVWVGGSALMLHQSIAHVFLMER